jgi:hypothetical protein
MTSTILDCIDCGRPWPAATRDHHTRCICPECTQIRLHDPRRSLSFPRDVQLDFDAQPEEAAA